jgi:hypothetical protein
MMGWLFATLMSAALASDEADVADALDRTASRVSEGCGAVMDREGYPTRWDLDKALWAASAASAPKPTRQP